MISSVKGHVDLFRVPFIWAPIFFFLNLNNLPFELITVMFITAASASSTEYTDTGFPPCLIHQV